MRTSTFVLRLSAALRGAAALTRAVDLREAEIAPARRMRCSPRWSWFRRVPCRPLPDAARRGMLQGGVLRSPARRGVGRGVARRWTRRGCAGDAARLLPRRRDAQAFHRFRHQDGTLHARENWNGKFEMVGNGGWAGMIQGIAAMQSALREGYAAAATDTGHQQGGNGMFALGHPEKITDFAYRAVHDTVVKSKMLITAYLRQGSQVFVLERLLHRRPAGAGRSDASFPTISTACSPERPRIRISTCTRPEWSGREN